MTSNGNTMMCQPYIIVLPLLVIGRYDLISIKLLCLKPQVVASKLRYFKAKVIYQCKTPNISITKLQNRSKHLNNSQIKISTVTPQILTSETSKCC